MVASARLPPRFSKPMHSGEREPRAGHAERMTKRDGAAMRIDVLGIVGDAKLPQTGEPLRSEGFVQFDQIEVADLKPEALHQFARRRYGADAHDPRRHRGRRHAEHARPRRQAVRLHAILAGENESGGAVIHA